MSGAAHRARVVPLILIIRGYIFSLWLGSFSVLAVLGYNLFIWVYGNQRATAVVLFGENDRSSSYHGFARGIFLVALYRISSPPINQSTNQSRPREKKATKRTGVCLARVVRRGQIQFAQIGVMPLGLPQEEK